jgi:hypothetical protein
MTSKSARRASLNAGIFKATFQVPITFHRRWPCETRREGAAKDRSFYFS